MVRPKWDFFPVLQSYLSSRNLIVNLNVFHHLPPPSSSSILGPLLFILYTTPLSSPISDSFVKYHLYADDTQLFISCLPLICQNISHLETTIDTVSTWMSANLLLLNQSKTVFLLIGFPKQLSKVSNLSSRAFKCHHCSN